MKSENWIIVELGACLMGLALLSFFYTPSYEKAVWFLIGVFATQFGNIMGYKFGRSLPQQTTDARPGQTSQVKMETTPDPPTPPTPPSAPAPVSSFLDPSPEPPADPISPPKV
jgi:hypothetical protein